MKRTLIVANWKMNLNVHEASLLVKRLDDNISLHRDVEVVLAPSLLALQPVSVQIDRRKFRLAAQNAHFVDEGAYTGEVSFTMLRDLVHYVIVGHSERRIHFGESLEVVRDKIQAAVRNGINPILCVGETKHERLAGETKRVINDQISTALSNLTPEEVELLTIAYEPVWAISTFGGELAKPDDISRVLKVIRNQIKEHSGEHIANEMRLLYGGSVDDQTAGGYLAIDEVDGLLVGSASLNYHKFSSITAKAFSLHHKDAK